MNIHAIHSNVLDSPSGTFKSRKAAIGDEPEVLAEIYDDANNLTIWQRCLTDSKVKQTQAFLQAYPTYQRSITVTPDNHYAGIPEAMGNFGHSDLCHDIIEVVDMFCTLFELRRAGLRLAVLDKPMCPRFHVDRVPCRLVSTYSGVGTEWLPHDCVDRSKLGKASGGLLDEASGLYPDANSIHKMSDGDVALLKGELWDGNENAGLVHRSPIPTNGQSRLVLTLDFIN